jgi:hypothetical protein
MANMAVMPGNCQLQSAEVGMRLATLTLSALAGLGILTAGASAQAKKLTGSEIAKLLVGATLVAPTDKEPAAQTFQADGKTAYQFGDTQKLGRWKVVGDKYCSAWDEKSEPKCADVFVESTSVAFVGPDGTKSIWLIKR